MRCLFKVRPTAPCFPFIELCEERRESFEWKNWHYNFVSFIVLFYPVRKGKWNPTLVIHSKVIIKYRSKINLKPYACWLKTPVRLWVRSHLVRGTGRKQAHGPLSIVPVKSGKPGKTSGARAINTEISLCYPGYLYDWSEHWRWICGQVKNMLGLKLNHPQKKTTTNS